MDQVQWVPIIEPANRANEMESGTVNAIKNPAAQDVSRLKGNGDLWCRSGRRWRTRS